MRSTRPWRTRAGTRMSPRLTVPSWARGLPVASAVKGSPACAQGQGVAPRVDRGAVRPQGEGQDAGPPTPPRGPSSGSTFETTPSPSEPAWLVTRFDVPDRAGRSAVDPFV